MGILYQCVHRAVRGCRANNSSLSFPISDLLEPVQNWDKITPTKPNKKEERRQGREENVWEQGLVAGEDETGLSPFPESFPAPLGSFVAPWDVITASTLPRVG